MTKGDVSQSYVFDGLKFASYLWVWLKEFYCFVYCHIQNVGNGFASVTYFESLSIIAFAIAYLTIDIYIWQKIHLYGAHSGSFARVASSSADIEGESSRLITSDFGAWQHGEKLSYLVKNTYVGGWIGPWCAPYGGLVYFYDFVDIVNSCYFSVGEWPFLRMIEMLV